MTMGRFSILCRRCNAASPRLTLSHRRADPGRTLLSTRRYVCDACMAKHHKRKFVHRYHELLLRLRLRRQKVDPDDELGKLYIDKEELEAAIKLKEKLDIWEGFERFAFPSRDN